MNKLSGLALAAAIIAGAALTTSAPATALPLGAGATSALAAGADPIVEQVQYRRRGVRPYRGGRVVYGRRGYGRGAAVGAGAAILGLGILGAAAAANAAPAPYCYNQRQQTYDRYGRYVGDRVVRVCE
jgi:hypothetical protein